LAQAAFDKALTDARPAPQPSATPPTIRGRRTPHRCRGISDRLPSYRVDSAKLLKALKNAIATGKQEFDGMSTPKPTRPVGRCPYSQAA